MPFFQNSRDFKIQGGQFNDVGGDMTTYDNSRRVVNENSNNHNSDIAIDSYNVSRRGRADQGYMGYQTKGYSEAPNSYDFPVKHGKNAGRRKRRGVTAENGDREADLNDSRMINEFDKIYGHNQYQPERDPIDAQLQQSPAQPLPVHNPMPHSDAKSYSCAPLLDHNLKSPFKSNNPFLRPPNASNPSLNAAPDIPH